MEGSAHHPRSPEVDPIRDQVDMALGKFAAVRSGEIETFREYVGMPDDGEHSPHIVNKDNVEQQEARFLREWSGQYPDIATH